MRNRKFSFVARSLSMCVFIIATAGLIGCGETIEVPISGEGSIFEAAKTGDMKTVSTYMREGLDVNMQDDSGRTLLHYAAAGNQVSVLEYLTEEYNANINITDNSGQTPLDAAREADAAAAVNYLMNQG